MKKIVLVVGALIFGVVVLTASMIRESSGESLMEHGEEVVVASKSGDLYEYVLPYPGVLPDNPLYFVKMIRDRVKTTIIRQENRCEYLLYLADKRIGAAEALSRGNKIELSIKTAQKAEQYMGSVVELLRESEDDWVWEKTYRSIMKHQELLGEMILRIDGEQRMGYERLMGKYEIYLDAVKARLEIEDEVFPESQDTILEDEGISDEELGEPYL